MAGADGSGTEGSLVGRMGEAPRLVGDGVVVEEAVDAERVSDLVIFGGGDVAEPTSTAPPVPDDDETRSSVRWSALLTAATMDVDAGAEVVGGCLDTVPSNQSSSMLSRKSL